MIRQTTWAGLVCMLALAAVARAEEKPADEKVLVQLDRKLPEIRFNGQGLADVFDFLRDVSGANLFVNWRELEKAGINKDTPVTLHVKDAKFRAALTSMLDGVGTAKGKARFTVEDGMVVISTVPDPKHPRAAVTVAGIPAKLDRDFPEINFNGQGLADVLDFMRDVTGTNIAVDWRALERAGIAKDAPVTVRVKEMKFSTVMRYIFEDVGGGKTPIECAFAENVLKVTAKPAARPDESKKADE